MRDFSSAPAAGDEPAPEKKVPFRLDEVEFTAVIRTDAASILAWSELAGSVAGETDLESQEGVAFVSRYFQNVMDPAEYKRWRAHMRKHKTSPEVLNEIMQYIEQEMNTAVEEEGGDRPTMPSSASSSGRAVTDERLSLIGSISDDGDVVVAPRPNRQQRRDRDRKQSRQAG